MAAKYDGNKWVRLDDSVIGNETKSEFFKAPDPSPTFPFTTPGNPGCGVNNNANVRSYDCNTVIANTATVCVERP